MGANGQFHVKSRPSSSTAQVTGKIGERPRRQKKDTVSKKNQKKKFVRDELILKAPTSRESSNRRPVTNEKAMVNKYLLKAPTSRDSPNKRAVTNEKAMEKPSRTSAIRNIHMNQVQMSQKPTCELPNVTLRDLFSREQHKLWNIVRGKIAVIEFWITKGRSDLPVSLDA